MALLLDIEPPSSREDDDGKELKFKSVKPTKAFWVKFSATSRSIMQRLYFLWSIGLKKVQFLKNLIKEATIGNRYLPHFAIAFLLLIVLVSNINETAQAQSINDQLINVDPDREQSIVTSVDRYTPIIGSDMTALQKMTLASAYEDGFYSSGVMIDTQVTQRTEPLPDNKTSTAYYVVKPGDTLTTLGMKFGVKLATLKYINDISDVDSIQPGVRLKIPPQGYEVSSSEIAKKDIAKKLAVASRNVVTRDASPSRQTIAKKVYYGTINGVRYVEHSYGQCYTYVTSLGYNVGGHLLAKWIPTNSSTPKAGGLVVTYESWAGHVAVVTGVNDDGTFNIRERNYSPGWITERTMRVGDGNIKGFVN